MLLPSVSCLQSFQTVYAANLRLLCRTTNWYFRGTYHKSKSILDVSKFVIFFGLFKPKITFTDKQMQIKTYLVSLGKLRSFLNCFCAFIANRCYNFTSTAFIFFLYLCLHIAESILESIRLLH